MYMEPLYILRIELDICYNPLVVSYFDKSGQNMQQETVRQKDGTHKFFAGERIC